MDPTPLEADPPIALEPMDAGTHSKVPPMEQRRRRETMVGGCDARCERPAEALSAFMQAVLSDRTVEAALPFVNSARLVHNGNRLGDRWAQLYMDREWGQRREEIDKWLKDWLGWVDRISDPMDREKHGVGFKVAVENQTVYVVHYRHPDLQMGPGMEPSGAIWRIEIRKRGLEWLVAEIEERPGISE